MADVVQKIISGNAVKNDGGQVVGCLPSGRSSVHRPVILNETDLTAVENKLTNKFNDDYYHYQT